MFFGRIFFSSILITMRIPLEPEPAAADLLVLGYQGTLAPALGRCADQASAAADGSFWRQFPVERWIAGAVRDLPSRISAARGECPGTCIEPSALVEALRERLGGILTQVLAACPDAQEESLARHFPALPPLLLAAVSEWAESIVVFHQRFHRDAPRLAQWLGYATLPGIASLTPARSDPHEGGHQVLRLVFRDGRSIFYKPRPVSGEWLWDRLVRAVNGHSVLQMASAEALAGMNGRYGWVASLAPHPALHAWDRNSADALAYWHAAGATLCLAAQVRMTDLHLANVIATSRGPVPVDAESFGAPRMAAEVLPGNRPEPAVAATMADLLDTGLLPIHNARGFPDVSGLFGKAAPVPGILVPHWSRRPDAAPRLQMVPSALVDQGNAPPGSSPLQALPELSRGYREAAEALMRCRDDLTAPGSAWRQTLEQHAPRIVLRDTLTCGVLISQSLAPEPLGSAHRRRIFLDAALRSRGALTPSVHRSELRNLLGLHIPRFTALPDSQTLAGGFGRPLARRFLSSSPAQAVLRGLAGLSEKRLGDVDIPALQLAILENA